MVSLSPNCLKYCFVRLTQELSIGFAPTPSAVEEPMTAITNFLDWARTMLAETNKKHSGRIKWQRMMELFESWRDHIRFGKDENREWDKSSFFCAHFLENPGKMS